MSIAELPVLVARVRLQGISVAVRWLRNPDPRLVPTVLRRYGATIGKHVTFKGSVFFDNVFQDEQSAGDFRHLRIDDNVYVGDGVYIDLAGEVQIGANSMISARACLVTHRDLNRSTWLADRLPRVRESVIIEPGASVSTGAVMLAGSVVATESVLAASALLGEGKSTEPRTVWAGVPARKIRNVDDV